MKTFHFYDRGADRPWINPMLTTAAIVGHTTATSTRLWMRAYQENTYRMVLCPQPLLKDDEAASDWKPQTSKKNGQEIFYLVNVHTGEKREVPAAILTEPADLRFEHDITHVWDIPGLTPGQRYYYASFALDLAPRKIAW